MQGRLLIIFLLLSPAAIAQFNDSTHQYINFTGTGTINKTNDGSSYLLNNNVRFNIERKRVTLNTFNGWIYGKQLGNLTNNDYSSSIDFNVYEKKQPRRLYVWTLAYYESSLSLKIHHRLQTGAGIGHHILNNDRALLILSDGILYEKSDLYETAEITDIDYETFRNSFRLKFKFVIWKNVSFEGSDFLQHSLSDRKDYIVKSVNGLSIKIVKWFSFTTAVTYNKITRTQRENFLLTYGLTLEKFF